jgi:hypothetical protein
VPGFKVYSLGPGQHGTVTTIPSPINRLPIVKYHSGTVGDPDYPLVGFRVQVSRSSAHEYDFHEIPYVLAAGTWYQYSMLLTTTSYSFFVDDQLVLDIPNPYYDFSQIDDWLFHMGDGDSHGYAPCDLSVDDVLLVHTKRAVADVMLVLGVPLEVADALYQEFGEALLQEALAESGGNPGRFFAILRFARKRLADEPAIRLINIARDEKVAITVMNVGDAPCSGPPSITVGLSYNESWVPEWATHFYHEEWEDVVLLPDETLTLEFDLPDTPSWALEALDLRLESLWTGYDDIDPDLDYHGFIVRIGDSNPVFGFLPLED